MSTSGLGLGGITADDTEARAKSDLSSSPQQSGAISAPPRTEIRPEVSGAQAALPAYNAGKRKPASALAIFFLTPPRWVLWIARNLPFIPRLLGLTAIARYDQVAEILSRHDVFKVPFSEEMARLSHPLGVHGTPFILGLDDEKKHDREVMILMQAFRREDIAQIIVPASRRAAEQSMKAACSAGRIDAIRELIIGVPLALCTEYFGVDIPGNRQDFADALIDISGHLFGRPPIKPTRAGIETEAAAYVRAVVDRSIDREYVRAVVDTSIERERENPVRVPRTVLARLVAHARDRGELTGDDIRAFMIGMIIGFVPTNTLAGGHILEMLLKHRKYMAAACGAARSGDDDLLKRCLFEALRFKPHKLGEFRLCRRDFTVAAGTPSARRIKSGTTVLVSTMAAMFDSRRVREPGRFDPNRPASDYLFFGRGLHWCVGSFLAQAQITQTFKALLLRDNVRAASGDAGKMKLRRSFPDHMFVEFGPVERS